MLKKLFRKIRKRFRIYTQKDLHDLWIIWIDENDINAQELFRRYHLSGSFVNWLEKKGRNL